MIAIELSKQEALDADSKAIQQIAFKGNLDATMFVIIFIFILVQAKEIISDLLPGTMKVFWIYFFFNTISVANLRKAFASNFSANVKLSRNQLHEIGQSGGFLSRLFGPSLKTWSPLIGTMHKKPYSPSSGISRKVR